MLAFYQRWAYRLKPFRPVFLSSAALSVCAFSWLLFVSEADVASRWQLTSVVWGISSLVLWLWSRLFARDFAGAATGLYSTWQRITRRVVMAGYFLLALLFSIILLSTLYLGLRAVKGIIATVFF